ncbi:MAG: hypothetical protein SVK54_03690 [candidate division WOR-3 bacterium]|nr:hypothetical protein [candidate division WOR-3 bacterium]
MAKRDMEIPGIDRDEELTVDVLKRQEKYFLDELDTIMKNAEKFDVIIRVIGSLAFRIKCPDYKYMEYENSRYLTDIDFIAYSADIVRVQDMFFDMGWEENQAVLQMFGDKRRIFYHPSEPIHSDIFIDKLRFCHDIDFRHRLEIDYPTISITDLLLEKLQIVEINKKDIVDSMMLLRQYPVSVNNEEKGHINCSYLEKLFASDWGWHKTAMINIDKIIHFADDYLESSDADDIKAKLYMIRDCVSEAPKSMKWKMRSIIGERIKWYREVEEVKR